VSESDFSSSEGAVVQAVQNMPSYGLLHTGQRVSIEFVFSLMVGNLLVPPCWRGDAVILQALT